MKKLTAKQTEDIRRIAAMPDKDIDFSDIPPIRDWTGAVRGRFYRPLKHAVTLRLDADVLHWFRSQGAKYQTRINDLLRTHMLEHGDAKPAKPGVHEPRAAYSVRRKK